MEIQIENYVSQIGRSKSATVAKRCEDRVVGMESRKAEIAALVAQNERELREAEKGLVSFRKWKQNLKTLLDAIDQHDAVELRLKLKAQLRELISEIEIFASGPQTDDIVEWMEALAEEYFPEKLGDPQFYRFAEYVSALRMLKRGRFVRATSRADPKSTWFLRGVWRTE